MTPTKHCWLCDGKGKRFIPVVTDIIETKRCTNCEGDGKVPVVVGWRPFEATKENVEAGAEYNKCNRHRDCEDATERYRQANGRMPGFGFHCHDEDCEDCFGC